MTKSFVKRALAWGLVGAMTWAMAGCSYLLPVEEELLAPPLVATKEVEYTTVQVGRGDVVETVKASGSFRASNTVQAFFETDGRIDKVHVGYGDEVKAGDVLMTLMAADTEYQYEAAKIRYAMQEETLSRTYGTAAKKMQQYQLDLAKLELDNLERKMESTILRAPIDGDVTYLADIRAGDSVAAYKVCISVSDPHDVGLLVTGEKAYGLISGREVTVRVNNQDFTGKIMQNPYDVPEDAVNYNVDDVYAVIMVEGLPEELATIGREAQVTMVKNSRTAVLTLPTNAVREYNGRTYVQVLQDGVKIEKDIVVGLKGTSENAAVYEIVSGLEEGESVIIN